MNLDLLNQLEQKVQTAVESMEVMKRELESLRAEKATLSEENDALKAERATWEDRLTELLDKFSGFETTPSSASASIDSDNTDVDDDTLDAEADQLLALATADDELNDEDGQASAEPNEDASLESGELESTELESAEEAAQAFAEADDSELSEDIFQMEEEDPHAASLASMISEDTQEEDDSSSNPQTPQPGGSHWQIN